MSLITPLVVNDALPQNSIWRDVGESKFREHVALLRQLSKGNPSDPKIYSDEDWRRRATEATQNIYILPLAAEQRIADDIAYVIAKKGEPRAVSAAALEQFPNVDGLTVRVSANGGVTDSTAASLKSILQIVERAAAKNLSPERCAEQMFDLVVELNQECLHARIQSRHWIPPRTRGDPKVIVAQRDPLVREIEKLRGRVGNTSGLPALSLKLDGLCSAMKRIEECLAKSKEEVRLLKSIVWRSYELCTPGGRQMEEVLRSYGLNPKTFLQDKTIIQIHKIGRYWGLCVDLAKAAGRYCDLFRSIHLAPIPRYQSYTPHPPLTAEGKVTHFVHAEIQLLSFYDLHRSSDLLKPRVLGVSKAACYLCNLFIIKHCQFHISKTHGKLYHQWNFPNLRKYRGEEIEKYRQILAQMDVELTTAIFAETIEKTRRPDSMESYVHLPAKFLPSATASNAGTLISQASLLDHAESSQRRLSHNPTLSAWVNRRTEALSTTDQSLTDRPDLTALEPPPFRNSVGLSQYSTASSYEALSTTERVAFTPAEKTATLNEKSPTGYDSSMENHLFEPQEKRQTSLNSSQKSVSNPFTHSNSSSTINLIPNAPTSKNITVTHPVHAQTDTLHLFFDIDPPAKGVVQISALTEDDQKVTAGSQQAPKKEGEEGQKRREGYSSLPVIAPTPLDIDVGALQINETLELFPEAQGNYDTVLNFRQSRGPLIRVQVRWLGSQA